MCGLKTGNLLMELKFFFVFSDIRIEKIQECFWFPLKTFLTISCLREEMAYSVHGRQDEGRSCNIR